MTKKIHPILKAIIPLAKGIAKTFGPNCEVVVHDLSHPKTSIIGIFNNIVTERKIGDGIRDLILKVLPSPNFKEDLLANYRTIPHNGKVIKSTTMLVRDEKDKMIGAICINFDLSSFYKAKNFLEEFTHINHFSLPEDLEGKATKIKINNANIITIFNYLISQTIEEYGVSVDNMVREDKIKIVGFLNKKGAFKIKGAAGWVADRLNISKPTIYNYLDIVRLKKDMRKIEK